MGLATGLASPLYAHDCGNLILGYELRSFVVFRVVNFFVESDRQTAVEDILRQVGPRCLGVANDDLFEQPFGFDVFLGGLISRSQGFGGMIDDPDNQGIGRGLMLRPRWGLGDRRHQRAILVSLDLKSDGLGQHQVVVCLPSLFGLAIAILRELFKPRLDVQKLVELDGRLFPFFDGRLDHFGGLDRENAAVE